jgi:hypothetical protein
LRTIETGIGAWRVQYSVRSPVEVTIKRWLCSFAATVLLLAASATLASFHTFRIEQLYSNADGSVQFIVMHEASNVNGENLWAGHTLTSIRAGVSKVYAFPDNLPGGSEGYVTMPSPTANKRVLIATQGFAALGVVTPDFVIPNGFLATDGGTLRYADVDPLSYPALPSDGIHAIDRNGTSIPNLATNFAGQTGSVAAAPVAFTPVAGLWANPNELGTGYTLDFKHGVLVVAIYAYQAGGPAQWYLASGPVTANVFTATLDKYTGGQCISCPFTGQPTLTGNDGPITITFTSSTSATVNLPGGRVTTIAPFVF